MAHVTRHNHQSIRYEVDTSNYTLDYTPQAGGNSALVVRVSGYRLTQADFTFTCSFGGTGLTEAATNSQEGTSRWYRVSMFYLLNPGTIERTITINSSAALTGCIISAVTLLNVDQRTVIGSTVTDVTYGVSGNALPIGLHAGAMALAVVASPSGGPPTWTWTAATEEYDRATATNQPNEIAGTGAYYAATVDETPSIGVTRSATTGLILGLAVEFLPANSLPPIYRPRTYVRM